MTKSDVLEILRDLPEEFNPDELLYRIELHARLTAGEQAIREGRVLTHDEAVRRSRWWFR